MVYIYCYRVKDSSFCVICPNIQSALSYSSTHAGDYGYCVSIIPYSPTVRTFADFINYLSTILHTDVDITKHDILVFEFHFNVSLLISDLYE